MVGKIVLHGAPQDVMEFMSFQVFAWEVADQLLTTKQSTTSCFIGAQTMRTKVRFGD
jgi:hypothetical protein